MSTGAGPGDGRSSGRSALLAIASVAVALAAADTYVVVLALPDMMAGVGLSIDDLQKATPVISGFLLGYIAVLPLLGRLSDLVSRQRVLLACLALFVVGSAVTALAVDLGVLVAGRVVQGVGGGGLVPATLALVADMWPPHRRGTPLGIVGAVQEVGSVLGPLLGAAVLAVSDWRGIFWLNVILGLLLAAALWAAGRTTSAERIAPDGSPADHQIDSPGVAPPLARETGDGRPRRSRPRALRAGSYVLVTVGITALLLALAAPRALTRHVTLGLPFVPIRGLADVLGSRMATPLGLVGLTALAVWLVLAAVAHREILRRVDVFGAVLVAVALGSLVLSFASADPEKEAVGPWAVVLLPLGAVAVVAAVLWHRIAPYPLVPRGLFSRRVLFGLLTSIAVGAALVAVVVDVPVLARLTLTDSQTAAALVLVRFLVSLPVGAVLGGVALRRLGPGAVACAGLLLASGALGVMTTWGTGSLGDTVAVTAILVAAGFGLGLAIAPVNAAVLDDVDAEAHGVAGSLVVVARMVGMVVGLALLTAYGLRRFYAYVETLPAEVALRDPTILLEAGIVQVQTVFFGAAICAAAGAVAALGLGLRRTSEA